MWVFPPIPQSGWMKPGTNLSLAATEALYPLPQPGDDAKSSELVSEVTQSTYILDKGTVCHNRHFKGRPRFKQHILFLLSLSSEFLFEKLLNVSGLYIFPT